MVETLREIKDKVLNYIANDGWTIVKTILVFIIGLILVRILYKVIRGILLKSKLENIICKFIASIVKVVLYVLLIMVIMQMLSISITGIVAILSAAGVAVALALQDSLSNLANGIILIASAVFKEGDFVSVDGVEGKVVEINMLTTTLSTSDNKKITLPNSAVMNNPVTNYSANGTRKVVFEFGVAYETNVDKAKEIVMNVMQSDGRVRLDPAPFVALKTLGDSSITILGACWCDSGDYWGVFYYVMDNVFNEFKRNNISIPYNQMEVRIRQDDVKMPVRKDKLPDRVEKNRKSVANGLFTDLVKKEQKRVQSKKEKKLEKKLQKERNLQDKKKAKKHK